MGDVEMGGVSTSHSMTKLSSDPSTTLSSKHTSLEKLGHYDEATGEFTLKEEKKYCGNRFTKRTLIIAAALGVIFILLIAIGASIPSIGRGIANEAVRDSIITFSTLHVKSVTDDEVVMDVKGTISNPKSSSGTFTSFPLTLYLAENEQDGGDEIGVMQMPSLKVKGKEDTPFENTVTLKITNEDNFVSFANSILNGDYFVLHMVGMTNLTAEGMEFNNIPFDKYLSMVGMQRLQNVTVMQFDLSQSTADQVIFVLEVDVYNPSPVSIDVGDMGINAYYDGHFVASGVVENFKVVPGTNRVHMQGALDTTHLNEVVDMLNFYLTGNSLVVEAKVAPGGMTSRLLNQAMLNWALVADIPVGSPIIQTVEFKSFDLTPTNDTVFQFGAQTEITIFSPLGNEATLDIQQVSMVIGLYNDAGALIGQTTVPLSNVDTLENTGSFVRVALAVDAALILADQDAQINFIQFVNDFANKPQVTVKVMGTADAALRILPLGNVLLQGVVVDLPTTFSSMDGLKDTVVHSVDFGLSNDTTIQMGLEIEIINPSIATVALGNILFDIFYQGQRVGFMSTEATFVPGSNNISVVGVLDPQGGAALPILTTMISDYATGSVLVCSAVASQNALSNPLFNQGFQGFALQTVVPASSSPLISGVAFTAMSMAPVPGHDDQVAFTATSQIAINSPLGPSGKLITQTVSLSAALSDSSGTVFGTFVNNPDTSSIISATTTKVVTSLGGALTVTGDGSALVQFVLDFVNTPAPTVDIVINGTTSVTVLTAIGVLTLNLPLVQTVSVAAIGGLPTVVVSNLDLPSNVNEASYQGINIKVQASLNNPSIATMALGGVQMQVYYLDKYQGTLSVPSLTLVPGMNYFNSSGVLNPSQQNLDSTGKFFTNYVAGLSSVVALKLDAISPSTTAPWLLSVLRNLSMTSSLHTNGNVPLSLISTVSMVGQMNAVLPDSGDPSLGGTATTHFNNPFAFKITVLKYTMNMTVKDNGNNVVGTISVPWSTVNTAPGGTVYDLQLTFSAHLLVENRPYLEGFISTVLKTTGTNIRISAVASVQASTGAGIIQVDNIPVNAVIPVTGFNNFSPNLLTIGSVTVDKGTSGHLNFFVKLSILSKSNIDITMGSATFDIKYGGVYVGYSTGTNMVLLGSTAGITNNYDFTGVFDQINAASTTAVSNVLSNYLNGLASSLSLTGRSIANPSPLQSALMTTTVSASLAGLTTRIISSILITGLSSGKFYVNNPTNVNIVLLNCNTALKYSDGNKGSYEAYSNDFGTATGTNLGTFGPKTSNTLSSEVDVESSFGAKAGVVIPLIKGSLKIAVNGPVTIGIDSFTATVTVKQYDISASF